MSLGSEVEEGEGVGLEIGLFLERFEREAIVSEMERRGCFEGEEEEDESIIL